MKLKEISTADRERRILSRKITLLTAVQALLFISVWFAYGLTINSGNLTAFGLQQAGVEAYVERHHFYLEGSRVELLKVQPVVDASCTTATSIRPNSRVSLWRAPQRMLRCPCLV